MRVIKTFDSLQSMGAQFGGEVFQDISDEVLYVYNRVDNEWYQYWWSQPTNGCHTDGTVAIELVYRVTAGLIAVFVAMSTMFYASTSRSMSSQILTSRLQFERTKL